MEADHLSPTSSKPHRFINDLDIVKKIIEREGCIEALRQILSDRFISGNQNVQPTLVLNGLIEQLREVSVAIVEAIDKWKKTRYDQATFQWKAQNYLLKMTTDLDQLLPKLQIPHVSTKSSPFVSPLDLTHPVFSEVTPGNAVQACPFVGNVDMRRIFYASRILINEITASKSSNPSKACTADSDDCNSKTHLTTTRIMCPELREALDNEANDQSATLFYSQNSTMFGKISRPVVLNRVSGNDISEVTSLENDLKLAKDLIIQEERTLEALKEKLAMLQAMIGSTDGTEKKRQIQNKIGALINEVKFCTGDLYQHKNELRRKEAIFHMAHRRISQKRPTSPIQTATEVTSRANSFQVCSSTWNSIENILDEAIELDELRRNKIIEFQASWRKRT